MRGVRLFAIIGAVASLGATGCESMTPQEATLVGGGVVVGAVAASGDGETALAVAQGVVEMAATADTGAGDLQPMAPVAPASRPAAVSAGRTFTPTAPPSCDDLDLSTFYGNHMCAARRFRWAAREETRKGNSAKAAEYSRIAAQEEAEAQKTLSDVPTFRR